MSSLKIVEVFNWQDFCRNYAFSLVSSTGGLGFSLLVSWGLNSQQVRPRQRLTDCLARVPHLRRGN